jgi:hypothetical protein
VIKQTAASDDEEGLRRWWGSQIDGKAALSADSVPGDHRASGFHARRLSRRHRNARPAAREDRFIAVNVRANLGFPSA